MLSWILLNAGWLTLVDLQEVAAVGAHRVRQPSAVPGIVHHAV